MAEKGSLLQRSSEGSPTALDTFDALIAVIVAKKKNYYVYAIAENDFESSGTDKNKQALKQRAQSFFESMVVHQWLFIDSDCVAVIYNCPVGPGLLRLVKQADMFKTY